MTISNDKLKELEEWLDYNGCSKGGLFRKLIAAYEESQADFAEEEERVQKLCADLNTANKRIAELEKVLQKKRRRVRRGYSGRQLR